MPAHALGLLCGTLRCAPGWRTALLLLFVAGLGFYLTGFLQSPFAGPAASRGIYAGSLILLGILLLSCVGGELLRVDDAERAPPVRRLLPLGALSLLCIGLPVWGGLSVLQDEAARSFSADEPDLLWHPDAGFVYATWDGDMLVKAVLPDGGPRAHPLRRWGWVILVALLGSPGWLLFMALEPRAPRQVPEHVEPRPPLLASRVAAIG